MKENRLLSVLIVDDEPAVLSLLSDGIPWEDLGFKVPRLFSGAEKALYALHEESVDLLITDVQMPGMSGLDLIETVRKAWPALHIIVISAFDNFTFIRRALQLGVRDYLLKPLDEHELTEILISISEQDVMDSSSHRYVDSFLYRWLHGSIAPYELPERLSLAGINLDRALQCVSIIRIFDTDSSLNKATNDILVSACARSIPKDIKYYCFRDEVRQFVLFLFQHDDNAISLEIEKEMLLEKLGRRIYLGSGLNFFITVSPCTEDIDEVPELYRRSRHFIEYSLIKPVNTVLSFSQIIDSASRTSNILDAIDFEMIRSELLLEHPDAVIDHIVSSLRIFDEQAPASFDLRFIIQEILMTIARTINSVLIGEGFTVEEWFEAFNKVRSPGDFLYWLREHVEKAVELIRFAKDDLPPVIQQIISLMKHNLADKGLCLKSIGYEVGMNPTYLGQLFRNEMGMLFTKHLTELRIGEAKRLLDTTDNRVQDIADLVGFSNQSYFNKVFKKYTGSTPMEYKRKNNRITG